MVRECSRKIIEPLATLKILIQSSTKRGEISGARATTPRDAGATMKEGTPANSKIITISFF